MEHKNTSLGYPMNFKHTLNTGGTEIEITLCNDRDIDKGDIFKMNCVPNFSVIDILEKRLPAIPNEQNPNNVNHHPDGVMFYKLLGKIIPN